MFFLKKYVLIFFLCFSLHSIVYGAKFIGLESCPQINEFVQKWKTYKCFSCEIKDYIFRELKNEKDGSIYIEDWFDSFDENNRVKQRPSDVQFSREFILKLPVFKPREKTAYLYGDSSLKVMYIPVSTDANGQTRIKRLSDAVLDDSFTMSCPSQLRPGEFIFFSMMSTRNPDNGYMLVYDPFPLVSHMGKRSLQAWFFPHLNNCFYLVKASGFKPNELVEFSLGKSYFFAPKTVVRANEKGIAVALVLMNTSNEKTSIVCGETSLVLEGGAASLINIEKGKFEKAFID